MLPARAVTESSTAFGGSSTTVVVEVVCVVFAGGLPLPVPGLGSTVGAALDLALGIEQLCGLRRSC